MVVVFTETRKRGTDRSDHCLNAYCFSPSFLIGESVCVCVWGGGGVRLLFLDGCFVVLFSPSASLLFLLIERVRGWVCGTQAQRGV